jgi:hypothetical protein
MNLIILVVVLLILFGGGGFYYGGPYVGGGLGTVLLIILIVLLLRGWVVHALTDSVKELRAVSFVLLDHSKALRIAAEAARERGAVRGEQSRLARGAAYASRELADAARKRQDARW